MEYKLYDLSLVPQLTRLLASTSDDKAAYVISLKEGKTEKDLLPCLNFRANGSGYYFDVSKLTPEIGVLLGTGNDCVRTMMGTQINFSKCNISCNVVGKPTHLILGGIVPFSFEIGKDVSLLHVDSGTAVDTTGEGSVVTVTAFALNFTEVAQMPLTSITVTAITFRSGWGDPPYYAFDDIQSGFMRQIGTGDFEYIFSLNYFSAGYSTYPIATFTSEIGSNLNPIDGLSIYFQFISNTPNTIRLVLARSYTNTDEIYISESVPLYSLVTLRKISGIVKLYVNNVELKLYKQSDAGFTTPVTYDLSFDLSKQNIFRIGKVYNTSSDDVSYGLAAATINKL